MLRSALLLEVVWTVAGIAAAGAALLAAGLVGMALVRRWRFGRAMAELGLSGSSEVPGVLLGSAAGFEVVRGYASGEVVVALCRTPVTPASRRAAQPSVWHVAAVRGGDAARDVVALRPAGRATTVVECFNVGSGSHPELLSFPSHDVCDEFVVFGTQHAEVGPAVRLAGTGLVPPDVAVIWGSGWLVLDFSARAFSAQQVGEMVRLARRLAAEAGVPSEGSPGGKLGSPGGKVG